MPSLRAVDGQIRPSSRSAYSLLPHAIPNPVQMMPSDRVRILVADDHAMFRDGLKRLVETEDDMHVVGEAGNATEAVNLSRALQPDVLLLDLTMPNGSGLDALRAIGSGPPTAMRSIMLSGENHR